MESVYFITVDDHLARALTMMLFPVLRSSTCIVRIDREPGILLKVLPNQTTRSPAVRMGVGSWWEIVNFLAYVCINSAGRIYVFRKLRITTGFGVGRLLSIAGLWVLGDAEGRSDDEFDIDGECQSERDLDSTSITNG